MKTLIIALAFIAFTETGLFAQVSARRDSVVIIAQKDAKALKLSKTDVKVFRSDRTNFNNDFFEPNKLTTPDTALLHDSAYVKAFRMAAYKRYKHKRTAAHYAIVGEVFLASAVVILLIAALATDKTVR